MGVLGGRRPRRSDLLAACGGDDAAAAAAEAAASRTRSGIENWTGYIDEETVGLFTEESGIDFKYTEVFNDNNEYFAKFQADLAEGRNIGPDIITPT